MKLINKSLRNEKIEIMELRFIVDLKKSVLCHNRHLFMIKAPFWFQRKGLRGF